MADGIEMVNSTPGMSEGEISEVQQESGAGDIEMYGGSDFHMTHAPLGSAQKGGKSSGIDMVGEQGLVDPSAHDTLHGQKYPCDQGKP